MWFRKKRKGDGDQDPAVPSTDQDPPVPTIAGWPAPSVTVMVRRPVPAPVDYATILVGDVLRVPGCEAFADEIERPALDRLCASVDGIGEQEVVGVITRPDGDVRWEPHPLFADVGVRRIVLPHSELDMVTQPDPSRPETPMVFAVFLDDYESELNFRLKDLALPHTD